MANDCKYQRKQYQISYDSGSTWHNAVPARYEKGELTEYSSPDCSGIEVQYRWRELEGQYICVDNNKYTKEIQEESYDNGATWYVSYPTVYKEGDFVEYNEEYCSFKFKGHYYHYPKHPKNCPSGYVWDGYRCRRLNIDPLKIVKCNDNDTLTKSETTYYIPYDPIISAEIGSCAKTIGIEAFEFCYSLSSVTIDNGVTSIEQKAFHGCVSITNIDIPDSVTNIGYMAFQGCTGLTSVTIGNGPTSIGNYAFYNCRSLQTITMGNYISSIGVSTFQFCTSLTSVTIPDSVTSIGSSAFYNCSGLTSIDIPNSVASIGNSAFTDCISLSSCTIGSGVTSIGDNAFTNCSSLVDVNIQSGSIGSGAFLNDYSITSLTLGNGVTSIGHRAFKDCTGITDVIIPDSVTDVGGESFRNCQSITGLSIGSGVTSAGGYAFSGCNSINTVKINSQAFIGYYWPDSLRVVEIGGSVTSITDEAFYYSKASTITIGDSVTSIGSGAFYWCTSLTSIVIPDSVTSIGSGAFNGCDRLTSITVEATTPPTLGNNAFEDTPIKRGGGTIYVPCESLSVYKSSPGWNDYFAQIKGIPPCEEEPKKIKAFYSYDYWEKDCESNTNLEHNEIPKKGSVIELIIGDCVTKINTDDFSNKTSLTKLTIGTGITSITESAFNGCTGLTSITIYAITPPILASYAFYNTNNCPIYVPSGSVNAYKSASGWSSYSSRIQAIP